MNYLINEEKLELKYVPGKGAWTYHIIIPNTKEIKGKWGDIKVSGSIDGYAITEMNLAPMGEEDKRLSINATIRKVINKTGGETVMVTLYLDADDQRMLEKEILEIFRESGVMEQFKAQSIDEQKGTIDKILAEKTEAQKIKLIIKIIETL